MTIKELYEQALAVAPFDLPSNPVGFPPEGGRRKGDMTAHLPILKYFATCSNHVTEFGLREGYSTMALASGLYYKTRKLVSYDIVRHPIHNTFEKIDFPCEWEFHIQNTIADDFYIDSTDFLFIDDLHTYNQVNKELARHGHKVKKFLGFHDTYSQGERSLDREGEEGILRAIQEYTNKGWKLIYKVDFNHGLQIYERM